MEILSKISSPDGSIIIGFLLFNLFIGIYFSRGITNIKEYALGGRNFSTATLVSTIVATWISSGTFNFTIHELHKEGLYFFIPFFGDAFIFYIIAFFCVPRMQEFLGKLSIADAMGDMYGNAVKMYVASISIIFTLGLICVQFSILYNMLVGFIGGEAGLYIMIFCMGVIIIYSIFGGMKAVTFTDVIQFFAFGIVIPMTSFLIWNSCSDSTENILRTLQNNPLFDIEHLDNSKLLSSGWLFLFFLIPAIDPTIFQRISMARNIKQSMKSMIYAGIIIHIVEYIFIPLIGLLIFSDPVASIKPDDNIILYIIDHYLGTGFKGLLVIGIMAMCMSTVDSYMHSISVLFYNIIEATGIKKSETQRLYLVKISIFVTGASAVIFIIFDKGGLSLLYTAYSFYMPVVSVPFTLAVFGFRSTTISVQLGMFAGFVTVGYTKFFTDLDSLILGMLANLITYMTAHYLLRQPGGWVGVRDNGTFLEIKRKRKEAINNFFSAIQNFSIVTYLINIAKKQESNYVYLGFFCIISLFFNLYSMPKEVLDSNWIMINFIAYTMLFLSTILITYPAWLTKFKNPVFISSVAHIAIFTTLVSVCIFVPLNNFKQLQIIILTMTLIITSILLRWNVALLFTGTGITVATLLYKHYVTASVELESLSLEFGLAYILLMISLISVVLLRPKEDTLAMLETKSSSLWQKVNDMDKEVRSANNIKTEFISNINHEVRTPMTGITSLSQALWDNYDRVPESKRRECVYTIAKNSERLISLMNNILDFSALTSHKISLHLKKTNITELVRDSLKRCKKLYLEDKDLRFKLEIENDVYAVCDGHYIGHTIDNLIINAISYGRLDTTVTITLKQNEELTYFAVRDEGIGIPKEELATIFKPFTTGTKTQSPAGGRGVGLALCYAAINAHKGRIWAESDGASWAEFSFEI